MSERKKGQTEDLDTLRLKRSRGEDNEVSFPDDLQELEILTDMISAGLVDEALGIGDEDDLAYNVEDPDDDLTPEGFIPEEE